MSETLLITLIGAAVVVVPLFISFRTTSFVEMKSVVAELKELIAKYEKDKGHLKCVRSIELLHYPLMAQTANEKRKRNTQKSRYVVRIVLCN